MFKKRICVLLSIMMVVAMLVTSTLGVTAATQKSQADSSTSFTFQNGEMSKEVLRSYLSRAVTHQGFCVERDANPIFEEDLRFLRRIGAKFVGRAAMLSWNGNLTLKEIENHFAIAKETAEKVHKADAEIILQAGIFEVVYKDTVNNISVPDYVFEAFGQEVQKRNFNWEAIVFPAGTVTENDINIGIGRWGNDYSGVPDITQLETKMYFYYMITRYIDAGYEAFHMGQAEMMMGYDNSNSAHWQTLLDKARAYAKLNARRGVALFDCHVATNSTGIKVDNNLVFDVQSAAMLPNETVDENGALKAEVLHYTQDAISPIGKSAGGVHPLGFEVEENFTLVEFDNYGASEHPGVATPNDVYTWGFDDITWFATQPEEYRNQFLKETAEYLSQNELCLDSEGKQQYFLQPTTLRVITPGTEYYPEIVYTPGEYASKNFFTSFLNANGVTVKSQQNGVYTIDIKRVYRANRNSDGCPLGFNQEDTIREIFLGADAEENPELLSVVMPEEYKNRQTIVAEVTNRTGGKDGVDTAKSNCLDNYRVVGKSNSFAPYGHVSNVVKIGGSGNGISNLKETAQTFLFDLNDATISFTPYIATSTYKAKLSVYGSKDGEIWLPLVLNEEPGNNARKGDNANWNPSVDATETGALTAWSNYNTDSMNILLTDNADKKIYVRFVYIGDGTSDTDAEAKAFGVTATYDTNATLEYFEGVESYISSAGNRSAEGAYWDNTSHDNDSTRESYFQKYMVVSESRYRGLNNVAEIRKDQSGKDKLVFKYDLNDNTTSFIPTVWVNTNTDANITIEASKDGVTWYQIVQEDVIGGGVNNGVVYGDPNNAPYIDTAAANSSTKKAWTTLNTENIATVLSDNADKVVYLKFYRAKEPASTYPNENHEYRGFGINSVWDNTSGNETIVAEVTNRTGGKDGVDTTKSNCLDNYRVVGKSNSFAPYGHVSNVVKIGGSGNGISNLKETAQTFLFDLNDATISFTPYIATSTYKAKLSVYGSKDGEIWLPLVLNEEPGNNARKGDNAAWNPDKDVTEKGALTAWSNYNTASMNALLTDNANKQIYLRFIYIGDGTSNTDAEAKAFGVTASYDIYATLENKEGVESYISSAGNRSAEGAYWDNTSHDNDSTRESYFQKYMVVSESRYRGLNNVAEIRKDQSGKDKLVFKYDLNDNTTSFIPTVWVNTNTDANITIEASKDGVTWYQIVQEDVIGGGVNNGVVYGDVNNAPYIDTAATNSSTVKAWTTLNTENIATVLSDNADKVVYLKFYRAKEPASTYPNENHEYRGFGITSVYAVPEEVEGDVNCDGLLNAYDATALINRILNKENNTAYAYDVNGDGKVDIRDLANLKRKLSDLAK